MNKAIGSRIRKQRELIGYTREQFAEKLDISVRFAADIELGKRGMSIETLIKICELFSVSSDYIIWGKEKGNKGGDMDNLIACLGNTETKYAKEIIKLFIKAMSEKLK